MPKITVHEGPSYGGHVDISPEDVAEPEWVPVDDQDEGDVAEADEVPARARRGRHEKS